jgi:hypothetical protein
MTKDMILAGALIVTSGCVSAGKYDGAVADAERARVELGATRTALNRQLTAKQHEAEAVRSSISKPRQTLDARLRNSRRRVPKRSAVISLSTRQPH